MAVSYEVYVPAGRLPDAAWLEAAIRSMEPSFALAGPYDFASDSGWCPCRLGTLDCGFEWALEARTDLPADFVGDAFDHVAQLSFRSADADAICTVLAAANLAAIAGGVLITPDDERVPADAALAWASAQVRGLAKPPKRRRGKVRDPRTPAEVLRDWLNSFPTATVAGVMRAQPDDPLVAIKFSQGAILKARCWAVSDSDGQTLSTAAMPREMRAPEIAALERTVERLVAILRSGPVIAAAYDAGPFELRFAFPGGTLVVYPQASVDGAARERALVSTERWELQNDGAWIYPDVDERTLVANRF